jgi:hypothetical protein
MGIYSSKFSTTASLHALSLFFMIRIPELAAVAAALRTGICDTHHVSFLQDL